MSNGRVQQGEGLYRCLDIGPSASRQEIRRAYLRLVPGAHPDLHPDDLDAGRRFRELTRAYEILGDPDRRARYDRVRQSRGHADRIGGPTQHFRSVDDNVWLGTPPITIGSQSWPTAVPPLVAGPVRVQAPVGTRPDSFLRALLYGRWL
jgi:curved DNA-binding protein CbpA